MSISKLISNKCLAAWLGLLVTGAISIAATSTSNSKTGATNTRESYSDQYSVLSDHNIFVRERYRGPTSRHHEESTTRSSPPIEESLVLTGIVFESQGFRAYVEDISSHNVVRLSPGDAVGRGKVDAIEIDAFDYDRGGEHTWVSVGSDLTGKPATLAADTPTDSTTQPSGSSTQPSGPPIDPNDPNLTLEQKMKLKRQQELNQR